MAAQPAVAAGGRRGDDDIAAVLAASARDEAERRRAMQEMEEVALQDALRVSAAEALGTQARAVAGGGAATWELQQQQQAANLRRDQQLAQQRNLQQQRRAECQRQQEEQREQQTAQFEANQRQQRAEETAVLEHEEEGGEEGGEEAQNQGTTLTEQARQEGLQQAMMHLPKMAGEEVREAERQNALQLQRQRKEAAPQQVWLSAPASLAAGGAGSQPGLALLNQESLVHELDLALGRAEAAGWLLVAAQAEPTRAAVGQIVDTVPLHRARADMEAALDRAEAVRAVLEAPRQPAAPAGAIATGGCCYEPRGSWPAASAVCGKSKSTEQMEHCMVRYYGAVAPAFATTARARAVVRSFERRQRRRQRAASDWTEDAHAELRESMAACYGGRRPGLSEASNQPGADNLCAPSAPPPPTPTPAPTPVQSLSTPAQTWDDPWAEDASTDDPWASPSADASAEGDAWAEDSSAEESWAESALPAGRSCSVGGEGHPRGGGSSLGTGATTAANSLLEDGGPPFRPLAPVPSRPALTTGVPPGRTLSRVDQCDAIEKGYSTRAGGAASTSLLESAPPPSNQQPDAEEPAARPDTSACKGRARRGGAGKARRAPSHRPKIKAAPTAAPTAAPAAAPEARGLPVATRIAALKAVQHVDARAAQHALQQQLRVRIRGSGAGGDAAKVDLFR